jgi:hypothetical protein
MHKGTEKLRKTYETIRQERNKTMNKKLYKRFTLRMLTDTVWVDYHHIQKAMIGNRWISDKMVDKFEKVTIEDIKLYLKKEDD